MANRLFGNNGTDLTQLAQLLQLANQSNQNPIETANVGGHNLIVNRPNQPLNRIMPALTDLIAGGAGIQQNNKKDQFLQSVQAIAKSTDTPEVKINNLIGLMAQHGTDYGFGIKDVINQYGSQLTNKAKTESKQSFGTSTREDAIQTAQGIIDGNIPPDPTSSSFRDRTAVNAELSRQGYNLSKANQEWKAVSKYLSSKNSTQQLRLNQAIESVSESLQNLKQINTDFERTGWTPANKVELSLALSGTDPQKRDIASRYVTQLNILTDELGQVFMGGNSPTDKALDLAKDVLNRNYSFKQLQATIDELEKNMTYRKNAINTITTQGTGGEVGSQYNPQGNSQNLSNSQPQTIQEGQTATNPKTGQRIIFRGGKWQLNR